MFYVQVGGGGNIWIIEIDWNGSVVGKWNLENLVGIFIWFENFECYWVVIIGIGGKIVVKQCDVDVVIVIVEIVIVDIVFYDVGSKGIEFGDQEKEE